MLDLQPDRADKRIIRGYTQADAHALLAVNADTGPERAWLQQIPRRRSPYFETDDDIHRAVASERLIQVRPTRNYRPAARFLNPELADAYPPYLRPATLAALNDLAGLWRVFAEDLGVSREVRLSVSSMCRTEEYQEGLVRAGKLAVIGSAHTAGLAVDIDRSGYYVDTDEGVQPVSLRPVEFQVAVGGLLYQMGGDVPRSESQLSADSVAFDWRVPVALEQAADLMASMGIINPVYEFNGTQHSCLHIGVHPDYLQLAA